jgi:signal transduction histidine kinase/DNA-binding response OmpR family regulator
MRESAQKNWIKSRVAELSAQLQAAETPGDFAQLLLDRLVPLVGGIVAVFYIRHPDEDRYDLQASWGFTEHKGLTTSCRPGEGLVGECVRGKASILLTDVPDDYLRISSGLGEAPPRVILVTPVISQDVVIGVIEIASFARLSEAQQSLVDELMPVVALNLEIIDRNQKTRVLLQQTQEQAQKLLASEETLRRQSEELTATNEELRLKSDMLQEQAEELRLQSDALEKASRYKSDFLANMSHEIRTPMNAVIGLTQLALDTRLDERQRDYLSKVLRSSRALLGILNDILDYSKIEAGRIDLEVADFSLEELLRATGDLFSVRAEEKGLELFIDIAPDVPDNLRGDSLRLSQVINNLVGNAIKFTERGEIHVRVGLVERSPEAVSLRVAVRDTGIGLTPEQAERLFQPFVQADASVTRRFGGSGLGLTISKRLVELMGGQIVLSSEIGKGSTFAFTVHLGVSGTPSAFQEGRGLQNLRTMRTLVVDDQETSLLIMRSILENWQFQVTTARSGEEGLKLFLEAKARGEAFDLLLLDWKMPGMNGLETALAIASAVGKESAESPPAVIMVTAYGREDLLAAADGYPAAGILTKPVTSSGLFDTLIRLQNKTTSPPPCSTEVFGATRATLNSIRGAHILLVEDNELNQQVAREFLAKGGLQVTVANNGQEALDLCRARLLTRS